MVRWQWQYGRMIEMLRSAARLAADLEAREGDDWQIRLQLVPEGVRVIVQVASGDVAHVEQIVTYEAAALSDALPITIYGAVGSVQEQVGRRSEVGA